MVLSVLDTVLWCKFLRSGIDVAIYSWFNENNKTSDIYNLDAISQLSKLIAVAARNDTLFATDVDGSNSINSYALVQCTRDIDNASCGRCLTDLMDISKKCCQSKIGWRVYGPGCYMRYENYSFTEPTPSPPPLLQPLPSPPLLLPPLPSPPPIYSSTITSRTTATA